MWTGDGSYLLAVIQVTGKADSPLVNLEDFKPFIANAVCQAGSIGITFTTSDAYNTAKNDWKPGMGGITSGAQLCGSDAGRTYFRYVAHAPRQRVGRFSSDKLAASPRSPTPTRTCSSPSKSPSSPLPTLRRELRLTTARYSQIPSPKTRLRWEVQSAPFGLRYRVRRLLLLSGTMRARPSSTSYRTRSSEVFRSAIFPASVTLLSVKVRQIRHQLSLPFAWLS